MTKFMGEKVVKLDEGLRVVSLFDGMSCGRIALKEAGICVSEYLASEIDKHAIGQTQLNFPDTRQIGSVVDVSVIKHIFKYL